MADMTAARAHGEDFLKRTEWAKPGNIASQDSHRLVTQDARRVVTALLDALREAQEEVRTVIRTANALEKICRDEHPPATARPEPPHCDHCKREMELIWACTDGHPLVWREAARPLASSLTQERLTALLREIGKEKSVHLDPAGFATALLPRLAGPAQEGPHE